MKLSWVRDRRLEEADGTRRWNLWFGFKVIAWVEAAPSGFLEPSYHALICAGSYYEGARSGFERLAQAQRWTEARALETVVPAVQMQELAGLA